MKLGDMVKLKNVPEKITQAGIIVRIFEKKCWRTRELGNRINWDGVDPEPHADVMIRGDVVSIPMSDLEVINESR